MIIKIQKELRKVADKDKAKVLARFFKTGKGEYGEGDKFLGVVVPEQRRIAKEYLRRENVVRSRFSSEPEMRLRTTFADLQKILRSSYHEDRLTALLIMVELYKKVDSKIQKQIFNFYLKNLKNVNNWDLVDLSAPNIVGNYLLNFYSNKKELKNFLLKLAKSKNLWSRRVAVLATFPFIESGRSEEIFNLTKFLIFTQNEKQDLMYKALGWMLREVGKKNEAVLRSFLQYYVRKLPRITLRYAIERMSESERKKFLTL